MSKKGNEKEKVILSILLAVFANRSNKDKWIKMK